MAVGILALQGNFSRHAEALARKGVVAEEIRTPDALRAVDGLILPGGESSTMLSLLTPELKELLIERIRSGLPVLATCAGVILLARHVENPHQESLGLLNVDVRRNAYGRQLDSFVSPLEWTVEAPAGEPVEGVFIRAPRITRVGDNVRTFLRHNADPVLVQYRNILAATFHPELSERAQAVHELFLKQL